MVRLLSLSLLSLASVAVAKLHCPFGDDDDDDHGDHNGTDSYGNGLLQQQPFTIRVYQDGYPNPGNMTNFHVTIKDGQLLLYPPQSNSTTNSTAVSQTESVFFVDNTHQKAYSYSSKCQQSIYVDAFGQFRAQKSANETIAADAITMPFYRFGKNPDKLVYTRSDSGLYTNPGPSIFTFAPWAGMGYWGCPRDDGLFTIWTRFMYWLPFDTDGDCTWLWLVALDYDGKPMD